jgi:hypothetical protein
MFTAELMSTLAYKSYSQTQSHNREVVAPLDQIPKHDSALKVRRKSQPGLSPIQTKLLFVDACSPPLQGGVGLHELLQGRRAKPLAPGNLLPRLRR